MPSRCFTYGAFQASDKTLQGAGSRIRVEKQVGNTKNIKSQTCLELIHLFRQIQHKK